MKDKKINKELSEHITDILAKMHEKPYWEKGSFDDAIDLAIDLIVENTEEE